LSPAIIHPPDHGINIAPGRTTRLEIAGEAADLLDGSGPLVARYQSDTVCLMAMTLRLTDTEQQGLKARAEIEGISMQEAARRAVREYVSGREHRDRVNTTAGRVIDAHRDAIDRLAR